MLTDDTLRKVRETARIDEVASGYLTLHRSGKDFVALCPFHDERHPSFRVSPARNIGKCFSCGEAADPIRLVCHMEGCGFEEAVRLLARKYNIEVEETAAAGRERRRDEREALLLANASFASGLLPGHPVGTARTIEDRHGLEETYCGFGVGLCPPDVPQVFRPFLGRLIFPIHTTGGQVAGFAGRSLTPSEKGRKYVNSPDSPAYHKGHILYGLHKAVKAVRSEGRILLCEGYKDVLAFHACGIRYAVGKDFVALCPFHDERHPSFRVSPARNIGKCFSCGEAADPIRLVCHMEGCGFEEAVRLLARKYNIEVEETAAAGRERRRDEREALLLANASFASGLLPGHPVGTARTIEDRHGLEETYCGFGVGLCPPDVPQVFRPFLGRLIFPIHTTGGQVAGFAGRSLTPSEKGRKYVNSPDSPAYHKGHILYGLHKAVKAVRSEGRILLCEGYKDVLAFHACGIRYAVGLCGTALTEEHIRAIRRLAGQVTLSLDPDPAGRQNTVRCAHMLLSEGCAVSLLPLPDGMDPDEVYRRKGSDELARLAREGTLDYLSYRIRQAASRPHTDTAAINETLGEIGLLSSPLAVYRRIGELSGATGIPIEVLRQEISVATGPKNVPVPVPKKEAAGLTPALPRERTLLRFCLTHHDRMFYDPDGNGISLPAWVSGELADNELPLEDPEHARLLHLLAEGKHPDGIADERLSALVLSLRASAPQDTGPVPDERLPDETRFQVLLYGESFARRKLARALESVRMAATPEERLRLQATLENHFALSDRIARELQSQSILPEGI